MTENTGTPAAPKPAKRVDPRSKGVWLTYADPLDIEVVVPHSSEIAALREAVKSGRDAVYVPFEQTLADAIKAAKS